MARIEIHCPHCRQLNVRYTGWVSLLHPILFRRLCSLCGTNLYTARRDAVDVVYGYLMLSSIYVLHALAGGMLLALPVLFLALMLSAGEAAMRLFTLGALAIGAGIGVWHAETARRKGELLEKHRERT